MYPEKYRIVRKPQGNSDLVKSPQRLENHPPQSPACYVFGDYSVDVGARKLTRGGRTVSLPSRVYDVLVYLIENRNRAVQKDEIISTIWNEVVVTDDSLIHAISVLRRALADERQNPKYIETIPRRGYRFIDDVRIVSVDGLADTVQQPARTEKQPAHSEATTAPPPESIPVQGNSAFPDRRTLVAALGSLVVMFAAYAFLGNDAFDPDANTGTAVRLFQPPPPGSSIVSGGILSPDGRYLAFVARDDSTGNKALWVKALQSGEMWPLAGSDGASKPFWSPESRRLGYFANGRLYVTDIDGERLQMIATVTTAAGAAWGYDDSILFAEWSTGLYSVPASGDGGVELVLPLNQDARDIAVSWPQYFPDSRRYLYQVVSLDPQRTGVYMGDPETRQHTKLLDSTSPATLAPPRHLLHVHKDMLIAEELDADWQALTGRAVVIARGIAEPTLAAENIISAANGLIAFEQGVSQQNLVWYGRGGERLDTLNIPTVLYNPRISPDGSHLLASSSITSNPGLWLASLDREQYARLEDDAIGPVWSPDGSHVAFTSRGGFDMQQRAVDSESKSSLLASGDKVLILNDWQPDGSALVFNKRETETGLDLWRIRLADGVQESLLATPFNESQARLSPDGNWIAYASDASGSMEVYVARYPGFEARQQVSINGGGQPQWRADQGELFYLSADRAIMGVAVSAGDKPDAVPAFAAPHKLFRPAVAGDPADARDYFAVNAGGDRFLVDNAEGMNRSQGITVIVNWTEGLQEVAPNQASVR